MPSKQKIKTDNFTKQIWNHSYFPYIIIFIVAAGIYLPTLSFTFSPLDDSWVIVQRFDLFFKLSSIKQFFSESMLQTYYRPIWVSSYLLDAMIGGKNPWIFHFMNIIYHAIACILFYKVLQRLKIEPRVSFLFALIFAVHPINVHSVALIPGRNDVLLGIFSFSSFIFFTDYLETKKIKYSFFCAITFALALFTKESAIVIPFIFIVYYILLFQKKSEKKPLLFFLILFILLCIWFLVRNSIIPVYPSITKGNFLPTMQDALLALILYTGKILLPINQAILPTVSETPMIPYVLVICFAGLIIWKLGFKDKKKALLGVTWFVLFVGLAIIAGSTKGNWEHNEERAYLPLAGILILVSQINFSKSNLFSNARYSKLIITGIVILLSIKTIIRSKVYANPYIMSKTALEESPHRAYFNIVLGGIYADSNKYDKALQCYTKYLDAFPNKAESYSNIGTVYLSTNQYNLAVKFFNKALQLDKTTPLLYENRAKAYYGMQLYDSTLADIMQARKLKGRIDFEFEKAITFAVYREKIKIYSNAILNDTATSYSYNMRGVAYYSIKDYANAIHDFSWAMKLNPNEPQYIINRGWIYENENMFDSAYYDYKKVADMGYQIGRNALENLKRKINPSKTPEPPKNSQR